MEKILTVSVAAYNVENSIRRALDSLIDEDIIDNLEIFVIDDGGTDKTLEIAQEYAEKYPNSIFPVHKENGGYGSTVNYSIDHASGKYFKLLDGDDWFDIDQLKSFIFLLGEVETDIIVTPYTKLKGETVFEKINVNKKYQKNFDFSIDEIKMSQAFGMWELTYKTDIIRKSGLNLFQHCLYSDQIYSTVPFAYAKSIRFVNLNIYCYSIGEDGQSTSKRVRINHIDDNIKVADYLCGFYESCKLENSGNRKYILRRVSTSTKNIIKTFFLQPMSQHVMNQIEGYDKKLKKLSYDVYRDTANIKAFRKIAIFIRMLRLVNYGRIGIFICKLTLPKDGIDDWA